MDEWTRVGVNDGRVKHIMNVPILGDEEDQRGAQSYYGRCAFLRYRDPCVFPWSLHTAGGLKAGARGGKARDSSHGNMVRIPHRGSLTRSECEDEHLWSRFYVYPTVGVPPTPHTHTHTHTHTHAPLPPPLDIP